MYVETWQIIVYTLLILLMSDFVRLLFIKLMSKRIQLFAIVKDTEQLRLQYISEKLNVPVTDIVHKEGNIYYIVSDPNEEYVIRPSTGYLLGRTADMGVEKKK